VVAFFTNIIHRFGVPNSIITDNGTQFTGRKFLDFCEDHHIRVDWATVAHPMTNGQVERANGMILQGLKPRIYNDLNKFGKRWMKELPSMVWSLRIAPSRATGFTPFFLVYGAEAILPTDLEYGSPRTRAYVRATAPPLTPLPCLLDCGTSTVTRGNPAYDPTVPTRHIDHGSVSRGRRRDGRYGQKWAGSNGGGRRAEAAVTSSAKLTSHPGTAREPSLTA
jgi:hypothetical protein